MSVHTASRRGAGLLVAAILHIVVIQAAPSPLPQNDDRTCFGCHDDTELKSSAGTPVSVNPAAFAASVHGQAGVGCVGCHRDLKGAQDFPHAWPLEAVTCAGCHAGYARATAGGVHGTASPRLAASPVHCKDCHGYHEVFPSSDSRSPVNRSNRPSTCGRCHGGAGANFAKGRVHELPSTGLRTPAGAVRILYKVLIAVLGAFFLSYIAVDIMRSRRGQ